MPLLYNKMEKTHANLSENATIKYGLLAQKKNNPALQSLVRDFECKQPGPMSVPIWL